MKTSTMQLLLLVTVAVMSQAEDVMRSETFNDRQREMTESDTYALGKTDWGKWGSTEYCGSGKYVNGFRLKVEGEQGFFGDDTALNGVSFHCDDDKVLSSAIGKFGGWQGWKYCPEGHFVNGINFRSEKDQGDYRDDTAGNNLNVRCTDGSWLLGGGTGWGEWDAYYCYTGQNICGMETKVEASMGPIDDSSLNRINVICC